MKADVLILSSQWKAKGWTNPGICG